MGYNIPNGFRFRRGMSFYDINALLADWRDRVVEITDVAKADWIAQEASERIDRAHIEGKAPPAHLRYDLDREFRERQRKIKVSRQRDVDVDVGFELCLFQAIDWRVYGVVFSEQSSWTRMFLQCNGVEDYSYWDSSDPPNGMEAEWEKRRKTWDSLMVRPEFRENGFIADCSAPETLIDPALVLKAIPSFTERLNREATRIVRNHRFKFYPVAHRNELGNASSIFFEIADYLKTSEGVSEVNAEVERLRTILPPTITREDL